MLKHLGFGLYFFALTPCLAQPTEVSFVPVRATGTYQILAPNLIYLPQGSQRIFFDFYIANWDPDRDGDPQVMTVQVATQIGSYGNPNSPSPLAFPVLTCTSDAQCIAAFGEPGAQCDSLLHSPACQSQSQCCHAFFMDETRPDWVLAGIGGIWAVDTDGARMGATTGQEMGVTDDGTRKYVGSLV